MTKLKEERGITLVALAITVLVLAILAGVTLDTLVGDSGIITKAQEASQNMENASREEDELIQNLLNDIKGAEGGNGGEIEIPEGTIEFGEVKWSNGQAEVEIIAKLREGESLQYQINGTNEGSWQNIGSGEKVTGLKHSDTVHARLWNGSTASVQKSKKIEDLKAPEVTIEVGTVTENSIEINIKVIENESGLKEVETYEYYIGEALDGRTTSTTYNYDELKSDTEYSLTVKVPDKAGNVGTATIKQRTNKVDYPTIESKLTEGKYVWYEDANGVQQKCMVLYGTNSANYSRYGIQIITVKSGTSKGYVGDFTLGSSNFYQSRDSYNNAISILNSEADKYRKKNDEIVESSRCVGSVPDNPGYESGNYVDTDGFVGQYGPFKSYDNNETADINQIEKFNIWSLEKSYWLACRTVGVSKDSNGQWEWGAFGLREVRTNQLRMGSATFCLIERNGKITGTSYTFGLRPVFRLKSGVKVTSGDGSESNPYTLAP